MTARGGPSLAQIEGRLRSYAYKAPPPRRPLVFTAAVALVLRDGPSGAEALLMKRAHRDGDPWSGQVSLPGGRVDPADPSSLAAAIRECREELGLPLDPPAATLLGRLDDQPLGLYRTWVPFTVAVHVFALDGDPPLYPDKREATAAFWMPLAALAHSRFGFQPVKLSRSHRRTVPWPARSVMHQGHVVWGMTRDILLDLTRLVG